MPRVFPLAPVQIALLYLMLPCAPASAAASVPATHGGLLKVGRTNYHGRCEIPRAGWNEEVLQAREAAVRECKENTVRLGYDRNAPVDTSAQERFHALVERHQALLRNARSPGP